MHASYLQSLRRWLPHVSRMKGSRPGYCSFLCPESGSHLFAPTVRLCAFLQSGLLAMNDVSLRLAAVLTLTDRWSYLPHRPS